MTAPIRFENLRRSFGRTVALAGLDLEVAPGQVVAILGRNGAGKTTAIKALLGQLKPDAGRAVLLGHEARTLPPALRRRVGYMAEGNRLDPWARVGYLLRFAEGLNPDWRPEIAEKLRNHFDLPAKKRVGALSNGQRGQLALILAIAADPEVLVLDDPMLGLDAVVRREFFSTIAEVLSRKARSVLFTSHILEDVERVADRVVIIVEGRTVANATLEYLRRAVRRFRVRLPDHAAPPDGLDGLLSIKDEGRGWEIITRNPEALRALEAISIEEESLPLEDIFVALTAPSRARRVMPALS
jgi:ABC-2 type transport system ATP-binding protein